MEDLEFGTTTRDYYSQFCAPRITPRSIQRTIPVPGIEPQSFTCKGSSLCYPLSSIQVWKSGWKGSFFQWVKSFHCWNIRCSHCHFIILYKVDVSLFIFPLIICHMNHTIGITVLFLIDLLILPCRHSSEFPGPCNSGNSSNPMVPRSSNFSLFSDQVQEESFLTNLLTQSMSGRVRVIWIKITLISSCSALKNNS